MFEDIMNGDKVNLTTEEWHTLFVLRLTNQLIDKGFVAGTKIQFTEKGERLLDEWLEKNGEPSDEELEIAFHTLFEHIGDGKVQLRS